MAAEPSFGADGALFAFVDSDGVVHITDRLGDVPEPYYSVYRAREAERQRTADKKAPPGPVKPTTQQRALQESRPEGRSEGLPASVDQAKARGQWQALMASWRKQLVETAAALQQAQAEAQGAANPLLKETPVGKQHFLATQTRLQEARAQALEARQMLTKTLPERAKREHVPPQWLTY